MGLCYQRGRFNHEVKERPSQGSTQQTVRPYGGMVEGRSTEEGDCIRSGNLQPTNAANGTGGAGQTRGRTTTHVETADVTGI